MATQPENKVAPVLFMVMVAMNNPTPVIEKVNPTWRPYLPMRANAISGRYRNAPRFHRIVTRNFSNSYIVPKSQAEPKKLWVTSVCTQASPRSIGRLVTNMEMPYLPNQPHARIEQS